MKKILFIFGLLFCLASCEPAPTLGVVGSGFIEHDEMLDDYFIRIGDRTMKINRIMSYRSGSQSFDYPVVGQEVICYKMSHENNYRFVYPDADLKRIEASYSSRIAGIDVGVLGAVAFVLFIFFMLLIMPQIVNNR